MDIEWCLRKMGEASQFDICSPTSVAGLVCTIVAPCLVPHTVIPLHSFKSAHPTRPHVILPSHSHGSAWPTPSLLLLASPLSS